MAEKHSRLGKGLNSIFGTAPIRENSEKAEPPSKGEGFVSGRDAEKKTEFIGEPAVRREKESQEGKAKLLKINLIQPNLNQPRKDFSEEALDELAESIKIYGIVQPILVKKQGSLYEIIAGERRWRAAKKAGLTEVPVILSDMDEKTSREVAIIENIQRSDLNAVEEALAYQSLLMEYGMTQEELADRLSKKRSTITNSLRLLKLEPEILGLLREGKISQGHGRALLSIEDPVKRLALAKKCAEEQFSVRELEKLSREEPKTGKEKKVKTESEEMKQLKVIYRDLETKLKQNLGTKVSIVPKNGKRGKLEIEYYSQEELDHLFLLLNSPKENA